MAAMQSQPVNPSVGSGDGDAATDSFKDGVISFPEGRWDGDVQREGGRQRRDEDYVQPARHVEQSGHGVPVPRTGCPPRSTYPRHAGPV